MIRPAHCRAGSVRRRAATTFSGRLVHRRARRARSAAPPRSSSARPSSSLVPSRRTTNGTVGLICSNASISPRATSSQRVMPPKMLNSTALTASLERISSTACLISSASEPPPASRKLAGLPARLGDDVERRHHQPGAVAEDADVAVELDVLHALLLGRGARSDPRSRCRDSAAFSGWRYSALSSSVTFASSALTSRSGVTISGLISTSSRVLARSTPRTAPSSASATPSHHVVVDAAVGGDLARPARAKAPQRVDVRGGSASRASPRRPARCPRRPRR